MCAVAANLIRVARPAPVANQLTVLGYYFDGAAGVNGQIHAYEYDLLGELVGGPFTLGLPTTGVFTDFVWSQANLTARSGLIYDGAPGLSIVEVARGGSWFWRPRLGTLASRIYYPDLTITDTVPIYVNGFFYTVNGAGGPGTELHRLNQELETVEIVTTDSTDSVSNTTPVMASESHYCKSDHLDSTTRVFYPLAGGVVSRVALSLEPGSLGAPYSPTQSLLPGSARFPRLLNVTDNAEEYLWPDEAPWLPQNQASRVQFAHPYILGLEFLSGPAATRVIVGRYDDGVADAPLADFSLPTQGGIQAFLAGIGSAP